ncbi:heterodisulfide reductase-related iron-sulfur binding cluster [Geomonas sp. Red276]
MEATREIYWNVGHGATGPMYCLAAVALALCGWGFWRRVPVYRLGRPLDRLDRLPERIGIWLKASFAQTRVLLVRLPGTLHALFFWGFLLLFIGTLLVMLQADFTDPLFSVRFLRGPFYLVFKVVLNTAGIAAIATLLGFAIRRYVFTPMNLQTGKDDYLSHLLLFAILITGFWLEGARMAATELRSNPAIAPFSFGGLAIAKLLDGWDVPRLRSLHRALWWFHLGVSMAFIALIPVTKLRHLFLTGVNYLFTDLRPKGAIEFPGDEVRGALANYEVNGNPFGMAYARRGDWAEGLEVAVLGEGEPADLLYFVGCYASFDRRNQAVARAFARICSAAGIRLAILGKEETCCGEPPRKLGNEYLYQQMARANIEKMQAHGVTKVVATCPHCYNTLVRDYRDLGFTAEVEHHSTFLLRLLDEGRLKVRPEDLACTYHDSCYLARYRDIGAEPRAVLARSGARITEMAHKGRETFCCGGGGGRVLAEERVGARISEIRIAMAAATGEPVLVANCPFCLTLFEDGIKTGGFEGRVRARDLAEVVAERLPAVS